MSFKITKNTRTLCKKTQVAPLESLRTAVRIIWVTANIICKMGATTIPHYLVPQVKKHSNKRTASSQFNRSWILMLSLMHTRNQFSNKDLYLDWWRLPNQSSLPKWKNTSSGPARAQLESPLRPKQRMNWWTKLILQPESSWSSKSTNRRNIASVIVTIMASEAIVQQITLTPTVSLPNSVTLRTAK